MESATSPRAIGLPTAVAGRALRAAGLAAWIFAEHGDEDAAIGCSEIQDVIDGVLRRGQPDLVLVTVPVAERAVELWCRAAELDEEGRAAPQLRLRASSLRAMLPGG